MFSARRSQVLNIILIIVVSVTLLLAYALVVLETREVVLDERKIDTQLILFALHNKQCFSQDFGTFEQRLLTQENIDNCFNQLDDNIVVRFSINSEVFYVQNKEQEFNRLRDFCSIRSTQMCSELIYPVVFVNENNEQTIEELRIQIIA